MMLKFRLFPICFLLLISQLCIAQTDIDIQQRNERIRDRWNRSLVHDSSYRFNKDANNLLVQTVSSVQPGKALCVAMGQGRNALYLARNGWEVTGFDLADRAIAEAVKKAEAEKLELHTEINSFETFNYGENQWDLITWLYGGCLNVENIASTINSALKPGGLFVFEFFHREAGIEMGRPQFGCEQNSIVNLFADQGGFDILLYEEKEGVADYGLDTNKLIYMLVSKKLP